MTRKTWKDKLTKKELKHLQVEAGIKTLAQLKHTLEWQEKQNKGITGFTCIECHLIGKKLNLI